MSKRQNTPCTRRVSFGAAELSHNCQAVDAGVNKLRLHAAMLHKQLCEVRPILEKLSLSQRPDIRQCDRLYIDTVATLKVTTPIVPNCIGTIIPGPMPEHPIMDWDEEPCYGTPPPRTQPCTPTVARVPESPPKLVRTSFHPTVFKSSTTRWGNKRQSSTALPSRATETFTRKRKHAAVNDNESIGTELFPICIDCIQESQGLSIAKKRLMEWNKIKDSLHC